MISILLSFPPSSINESPSSSNDNNFIRPDCISEIFLKEFSIAAVAGDGVSDIGFEGDDEGAITSDLSSIGIIIVIILGGTQGLVCFGGNEATKILSFSLPVLCCFCFFLYKSAACVSAGYSDSAMR